MMNEQQSNKQGLRSSAQREHRARNAYGAVPPGNEVGGAFAKREPESPFEKELSLSFEERLAEQRKSRRSEIRERDQSRFE